MHFGFPKVDLSITCFLLYFMIFIIHSTNFQDAQKTSFQSLKMTSKFFVCLVL